MGNRFVRLTNFIFKEQCLGHPKNHKRGEKYYDRGSTHGDQMTKWESIQFYFITANKKAN